MPHAHTFDIELRLIPNWLFILGLSSDELMYYYCISFG